MSLESLYNYHCTKVPSDINEHLPTLRYLAEQCEHVTEMWVRTWLSSTALLMWCKNVTSYDLNTNDCVEQIKELAPHWNFKQWDVLGLDIEETDMLFIDTLHNGDQLEKELERHASKVKKFIAFHDTTTFGNKWETNENWLLPAMNKFLKEHKEWVMLRTYTNNNGLTIWRRLPEVVVYTSIYGDYETLKKQPEQTIPCKFVCFTDSRQTLEEEDWHNRDIIEFRPKIDEWESYSPALKAKYFRTHPFAFFKNQYVIYIDGSAKFQSEFSVELLLWEILQKSDMLVFKHPDRDCIFEEAKFCKDIEKYKKMQLMKQAEQYKKDWHPEHYWLSATWLLVFNKSESLSYMLDDRWEQNIKRWTQCQISFEAMVRKHHMKRQWIDSKHLRNNIIVKFYNHK